MDSHLVYIIKYSDGGLYTGYARDVNARVKKHNRGQGAKYTKMRRPMYLVYQEMYEAKSGALKREYEIKTYTRQKKLRLIKERQYGCIISSGHTNW